MPIEIPDVLIQRLQSLGPHFCIVRKKGKNPDVGGQGWNKKEKLMQAEDPKLQQWLQEGGNYGVVGGYGLVIIDLDHPILEDIAKTQLPSTFTVKSPGSKCHHLYYIGSFEKPIRLYDKNKENIGDIQGLGKMVVGPGSIHPNGKSYEIINDQTLSQISRDELVTAFKDYVVPESIIEQYIQTAKNEQYQTEFDLNISQVVPLTGLKKRSDEYYGPHPIHGSKGGQNFWVNTTKNCWCCFRHDTGGGPLQWLAVETGIITCEEAIPGALQGPIFLEVLNQARDKGLIPEEPLNKKIDVSKEIEKPPRENSREKIIAKLEKEYLFYCDRYDRNLNLYVWIKNSWQPIAEAIILAELSSLDISKSPEISKDKLLDYFKGKAQSTKIKIKPPYIIPFQNGIYDLTQQKLLPHDPKYFVVNVIPHNYNPKATNLNWHKFLSEVHYKEDLKFLQEWYGYKLYTSYSAKGFVILIGNANTGKSRELIAIENVLGHKNLTNITLQNLNHGTFHLAELHHKLANISDDISKRKIRLSGNLKVASDGGWLNAQKKFGHPFDFKNYAKITNSCNEPPEIEDKSSAVWARLRYVLFPYTFKEDPEQNEKQARRSEEIDMELATEAEGIILWMLEGLKRLIKNKFVFSYNLSNEEVKEGYMMRANPVLFFIDKNLENTGDDYDIIMKKEIYPMFQAWCKTKKLKIVPNSTKFFRTLKDAGLQAVQKREFDRERAYVGYKCHGVTAIVNIKSDGKNSIQRKIGER